MPHQLTHLAALPWAPPGVEEHLSPRNYRIIFALSLQAQTSRLWSKSPAALAELDPHLSPTSGSGFDSKSPHDVRTVN